MFGWPERFNYYLGALCLLGSYTPRQTIIYINFSFNRQIRSVVKVGFGNVGQGEAQHVSEGCWESWVFRSLLLISGPSTTLRVLQYKHPTGYKTNNGVRPPSGHVNVTRRPAIITRLGLFWEGWSLPACLPANEITCCSIQNSPAVAQRMWRPHTTCCRFEAGRLLCNPLWTLIKKTVDIISATSQCPGGITSQHLRHDAAEHAVLVWLWPRWWFFFSLLQKSLCSQQRW